MFLSKESGLTIAAEPASRQAQIRHLAPDINSLALIDMPVLYIDHEILLSPFITVSDNLDRPKMTSGWSDSIRN
jgi:hypothetical protein